MRHPPGCACQARKPGSPARATRRARAAPGVTPRPPDTRRSQAMWRNRLIPRRGCLLCAVAGLLATAGVSRGDDLAELKARLEAQGKQIQELRRMLEASEGAAGGKAGGGTAGDAGAVAEVK